MKVEQNDVQKGPNVSVPHIKYNLQSHYDPWAVGLSIVRDKFKVLVYFENVELQLTCKYVYFDLVIIQD